MPQTHKLLDLRLIVRGLVCAIAWIAATARALAHEPFDLSSRVTVHGEHIELTSTVGTDAARQLFAAAGLPPAEIAKSLRTLGPDDVVEQPTTVAARFFQLEHDGAPLAATSVTSRSEGMEIILTVMYPRPAVGGRLMMRAVCYETIPDLRSGALLVLAESGASLGAALLSATSSGLAVTLPPSETAAHAADPAESVPVSTEPMRDSLDASDHASRAPRPGAWAFFTLGVEHILIGIDHLLFLAALLIGVRRLSNMLKVVTCFTLAHSITLALAGLNLVLVSPRVVEPLIALSIIVVCILNFVRPQAESDRWWLAGGFGLIHGFGFATALQATGLGAGGNSLFVPLLSFNLGVEAGQLAVAAVFLPILFAVRRWPAWPKYGFPGISAAVITTSGYWCWERLFAS